ncbi:MAG: hypothetical protein WC091_12350, partial [Sulfuricellaceae bacterium]
LHVFLWVFRSAARLGVEILTMAFTMDYKPLIFRYGGLLFWGKIILPPLASPCYARAAAQRKWLSIALRLFLPRTGMQRGQKYAFFWVTAFHCRNKWNSISPP